MADKRFSPWEDATKKEEVRVSEALLLGYITRASVVEVMGNMCVYREEHEEDEISSPEARRKKIPMAETKKLSTFRARF